MRYSDILQLWKDPTQIRSGLNYLFSTGLISANNRLFSYRYGDGVDIMAKDWDNLLILDACRYDVFKRLNPFDGKLNKVVSKGSHSREFIDANFRGGSFHDTVYVTANAKAWDVDDSTFYNMIRTYGQEQRNRDDQSRYRAYSPEVVYDIACSAYEQHQDKRLIVHFMQPHAPYFGTNAMKLREELRYKYDIAFNAWDSKEKINESEEEFKYLLKVAKEKDYISAQELYDVYIENLEYVFTYVKRLLDKLEGKTVITADHGELLGFTQNRLIGLTNINRYEHPKGVHIPELCFVPWLIIESDKRRKIMAHDPIETGDITQEQVDEQLEALGYK